MTRYPHAEMDRQRKQREAEERAQRKQQSAETQKNRAAAKALLSALFEDDRFTALAQRCGSTPAQLRKDIKSRAHWQPHLIIKLAQDWGVEGAAG